MLEALTTPLNAVHREMDARMVDFGGWEMPLHYGSQIEEHRQVRRDAGMFDVSHMLVVDLHGASVRDFLRRILANNVDKLQSPGTALYTCMLNERGGVIDDLIVYFMREDWFRMVVNAGSAQKDLAWLNAQCGAIGAAMVIAPRRDLAIIAVQGPNARSKVWQAMAGSQAVSKELKPFQATEIGTLFISRTGYTGEDGFEIMMPARAAPFLWKSLAKQTVAPIGLGARDTLRLEAGMNLYGQDMDENTSPLEAGLAWTVDLDSPRDFIGKAVLAASKPARHALGVALIDKGVMRSHQKVMTAHGDGEITSGSFGPTLGRSIALARVPVAVKPGDEVEVKVRGKSLRARVVKPPFVRHGKILVNV